MNNETDEHHITTRCIICGTPIDFSKNHGYLRYNEWQHSFIDATNRCFKKHFGYDLDKEQFERSSKIFFMNELRRLVGK